ncbi:MAG TPA: OmpA family protein [Elusimicrobiales bacterium]|nr:OmpA family protein [Elusimicrobiales bacterium]
MRKHSILSALALPLLAALLLSSCAGKNTKKGSDAADMTGDTATIPALEVQESSDTMAVEGDIRGPEFRSQENLKTVNFSYGLYDLSEESRKVLQANATLLKARKEWTVLVEGHCDERGTTEFNLALGQKRAKAVRDYYVRLGVPESAIGTISYGEEMPLCQETTEDCWMTNRRAETKIKG